MKIRNLLLILTLTAASVLLPGSAAAQTEKADGGITGRVVTRVGRSVIDGVKVTVQGTGLTFYTDSQGRFTIPSLPAGQYTLDFTTDEFRCV